eukprot:4647618-Pleurochrysis_carterae.AAC.2
MEKGRGGGRSEEKGKGNKDRRETNGEKSRKRSQMRNAKGEEPEERRLARETNAERAKAVKAGVAHRSLVVELHAVGRLDDDDVRRLARRLGPEQVAVLLHARAHQRQRA